MGDIPQSNIVSKEEDKKAQAINQAHNEIQQVLKKHNVKVLYEFDFPIYRQLPDEVKLAMAVLAKHNMVVKMVLSEK